MEFVKQNLAAIIGVVIVIIAASLFLGGKKKKEPGENIRINVKCRKCAWQGTVSKYNQVCPKCAGKDLAPF